MPIKSNLRLFPIVLPIGLLAITTALTQVVQAQVTQTQSIPPDSTRWQLEGEAKVTEYQNRKSLFLDGGAAILKDSKMRDAVIDVDVATPATRGFFGIQFRIADDGANSEWVYLRQHKSGLPDAIQYTPVLNTGLNWQSTMDQASLPLSIFPETRGSTCVWKSRVRKPNSTSKTWTSLRWS